MSRSRLHPAWVVAGATFVVLLAAAGVRAAVTVLILPLEAEFGWSRATISAAISLNLILFGLVGPFAAALMQRWGMRRTCITSLTCLATAVALTTRMTQSWQLVLLWGLLVGTGTGMMALVLGATVVARWFTTRRGVVIGVLTASTATGQLIFLPLLARLIELHGWRTAAWLVTGILVLMIPVVLLFLRERPQELGIQPYGADPAHPPGPPRPRVAPLVALGRAAGDRQFWLLFATFFICGASTNGLIGTHLIPAAHDHGIGEVTAAGLLAAMGIFDVIGTIGSGWLTDRWDSRKLLATYYGLRGLALLGLPFALLAGGGAVGLPLQAFAVLYGLDWIATVPPTLRLTMRHFGDDQGTIVYGWIVAGHQLGAASAAYGAGLTRTLVADYEPAFLISGLLCLLAAGLALRVRHIPRPARTAT